jgi:hypothetical protein
MPSVELDKFFVNGVHTSGYEVVSNVAIQYPTELLQGKTASAVHVNPLKLIGMTKKLVMINKQNPVIPVPEINTEYYAFKNGVGKLIVKSNDSSSEYKSITAGIELSQAIANAYDFILAISYKFGNVKHEGNLNKGKIILSGTNSIYIGQLSDPICVFVSGMYLDEDSNNYTYDSSTGYLSFSLETKMDVGVIAFSAKEKGTIISTTPKATPEWGPNPVETGIIQLSKKYTEPLVFVSGESLDLGLADYHLDEVTNIMYVKDAQIGMKYAVVESIGGSPNNDMYIKAGIVDAPQAGETPRIPCSSSEMPITLNPILFVDGIMIAQRDIIRNTDNSITTYGLQEGQSYTLLKDPEDRLVFDDLVSFTTIPTPLIDDALVYIEDHLICDSSAVYASRLPTHGVGGELKLLLLSDGTEQWYQFNSNTSKWELLDQSQPGVTEMITQLNSTTQGYSTSKKSISILQNFGPKECVYYAYSFANSIEEPLLVGDITTNDIDTVYDVSFRHPYQTNLNSLSVWMDGVRQYYINEINSKSFEIPEAIASKLLYVVERLEAGEVRACERNILTSEDRLAGTVNTYRTSVPLYPGNVRVFISGYRQPSSAYKILDPQTIMFNAPLIGGFDNFPIEMVEVEGKQVELVRNTSDKILIEVRKDFNLREIALPVRYQGQAEWTVAEDGVPMDVINSKDFLMIYINGAAYGREYIIDKERESIILRNEEVTKNLGVDPIFQYFKDNPDSYLEWRKENNYAEYKSRLITDKIIFEWR